MFPARIMKLIAVLLVCLAVKSTLGAKCSNFVSCPCGTKGENVTVCFEDSDPGEACTRLTKCEACEGGLDFCSKCPEGLKGPFCTEEISGRVFRQKRQSGNYEHRRTRPSVRFCQDPGVDLNGSRQPRTPPSERGFPQGTRLLYFCNEGYELDGQRNIFCLTSGEWSAERPECTPGEDSSQLIYCKYPGAVANGRMVHIPSLDARRPSNSVDERQEKYPEGSRLQFSCKGGYTLKGPRTLMCRKTGKWAPATLPTCTRDDVLNCDNPGPVLNGRVRYFGPGVQPSDSPGSSLDYELEEYLPGTVVEYYCEEGYRLVGSEVLTCQSSGLWTAAAPVCIGDCGRSLLQTSIRIRDGQKTMSGEWPWVVSISLQVGDTSRFVCGGAVLSTRTVLTAAHCLERGRTYILRFAKHHFRVEDDDSEVLIRRSNRVIIHPNYSDKTMDADIGLITFKSRIRYSVRVQPICLPTLATTQRNTVEGTMGYVSGWGETEEGLPSDELLLSSLPVQSDEHCAASYRKQNLAVSITNNMFCAGYYNGSYSVCGGDSGSPFVFYDRVTERYTLEGLVSFAVRRRQDAQACGLEGRYPIFTKVVRFVPWIYQNMEY